MIEKKDFYLYLHHFFGAIIHGSSQPGFKAFCKISNGLGQRTLKKLILFYLNNLKANIKIVFFLFFVKRLIFIIIVSYLVLVEEHPALKLQPNFDKMYNQLF